MTAQKIHPYNGSYTAISVQKHIIFGLLAHNEGSDYYIVDDVIFADDRKLPGETKEQTIIRQGPQQIVLERHHVTSIIKSSKTYHQSLREKITD